MNVARRFPLIAVDIGNTQLKFGRFDAMPSASLPTPSATIEFAPNSAGCNRLVDWLAPATVGDFAWWIGSVNRDATESLTAWLGSMGEPEIFKLAWQDLPLSILLSHPECVGIDRLLNAVAANRVRAHASAAIVIDLGTAITVDLLSADGAFEGGAIMPGLASSARALHEFTDVLPLIDTRTFEKAPPALGVGTEEAMRSGLYWNVVGGVNEVVRRLAARIDDPVEVFITGGGAASVTEHISPAPVRIDHLTLAGVALAAASAA